MAENEQDRAGAGMSSASVAALPSGAVPSTPEESAREVLAAEAQNLIRAAKAPSTLRAYAADWRHFMEWCAEYDFCALPASPETVALYLAALARTHRPTTITRRLTAITKAHQVKGLPSPATVSELAVGETLKGIRRTLGVVQKTKAPLLTADLLQVLAHLPPTLAGARDRALLLVGYAGAFRRSELAALKLEHVAWVEEGAVLTLKRSKTDQEGQGRQVAVPRGAHAATCPVRALRTWIEQAGLTEGRLFRAVDRHGRLRPGWLHPDAVGEIVKRALGRAGFEVERYGGHSLRAGFATQAAQEWRHSLRHHAADWASVGPDRVSLRAGSSDLPRCAGGEMGL